MRIVFCFIPCNNNLFNELKQNLGNIISEGVTSSEYKWFVSCIQNNDFFCIHQSMGKNNQKLSVTRNLIQSIINELKKQQQNIKGPISAWVFRHHTSGDESATDQPGDYIDSLQEKYVKPFANNQSRTLNEFLNKLGKKNQPHLTFNDPLIIVFTPSGRQNGEWEKSIEVASKNKGNFYDDDLNPTNDENKIRVVEFKINNNYTILFVKEDGDRTNPLDNLLNKILSDTKWKDIAEKYVAVHDLTNYINDVSQFKNQVKQICDFHHYDSGIHKEFWVLLIKFLDEVEKGSPNIKNICEEIIKKIDELSKNIIQSLPLLKHRIAHLFLALDIDLQGISEVEDKKIEYLKEVLDEKKNEPKDNQDNPCYYRQKLADLWYMVVKKDFSSQKINECEIVRPTQNENSLPERKAIIDLIEDEKKKNEEVKKYWKLLLKICGLKFDNNNPFDSSKINPDENLPIIKFMCLMDSKIKKNKIEQQDVNKILNYFSELNNNKGWEVKGAKPEVIKSFHDWFCALIDCLDKIREKLKNEQGK